MKKILMIAYFYPPKGGPGVQRTAKFAKYLTEMGYDVHVLTVLEDERSLNDASLNEDIVEGIKVYRVPFREVQIAKKINSFVNSGKKATTASSVGEATVEVSAKSKLKSRIKEIGKKVFFGIYDFIFVPDDKKSWINDVTEEALKIIEKENIDVLYTTSAPYSAHVAGYNIKKKCGIKWIADFRDQWVTNPFVEYGALTIMRHKSLEKKVMDNADKVITVSKPIIDDFLNRYPNVEKTKFEIITNGYDEDDFKNLKINNNEEKRFKIVYNGTLYGRMTPENILIAIDELIGEKKVDSNKIKMEFCGNIGTSYLGIVEKFKSKHPNVVSNKSYLPHKESLENLVNANAALLIIDDGKGCEGIYTGKVFEYIRSGKPIIGIVPDGVARDLIIKTNTGLCVYPGDIKTLKDVVEKLYKDYINNEESINAKWDEIEKSERRNLTKKLSNIINNI